MDKSKVVSKLEDLKTGIGNINGRIQALQNEIQKLLTQKLQLEGAAADCREWIKEYEKEEKPKPKVVGSVSRKAKRGKKK